MPNPQWEEEIREEVAGNMTSIEATNHLIDVISALLQKQKETLAEEIIPKDPTGYGKYLDDWTKGYNACREEMLKNLTLLKDNAKS